MSDWPCQKLADLADIRVSNVDKKTIAGEAAVRLCNYMDVYANDYIRRDLQFMSASATAAEIARFKVERGDVLLTKDSESPDDIGIAAVVDDDVEGLVCGYHLAQLKPRRQRIDPAFLAKQLNSSRAARYFAQRATGSTRYGLSSGTLAGFTLPLPPLSHQQAIAGVLRSVDNAITRAEELIAKYQQIKAGLMYDLFTHGLQDTGAPRPSQRQSASRYKETPIGWIPAEWSVAPLGTQVEIIDPNPSHRYPDDVSVGVPICSTENFVGEDDFDLSGSKLVPVNAYIEQEHRCRFKPADVVFARKGRIGLARRYGYTRKAFSHTVVLLKPKAGAEVDARWLLWAVRAHWFLGGIERTMNSNSGVPTLGVDFIARVVIPFPPLAEQSQATKVLDQVTDYLRELRADLDKLHAQRSGLMQDLLTGKVEVASLVPEAINA